MKIDTTYYVAIFVLVYFTSFAHPFFHILIPDADIDFRQVAWLKKKFPSIWRFILQFVIVFQRRSGDLLLQRTDVWIEL